jgi:hypothetical protein
VVRVKELVIVVRRVVYSIEHYRKSIVGFQYQLLYGLCLRRTMNFLYLFVLIATRVDGERDVMLLLCAFLSEGHYKHRCFIATRLVDSDCYLVELRR